MTGVQEGTGIALGPVNSPRLHQSCSPGSPSHRPEARTCCCLGANGQGPHQSQSHTLCVHLLAYRLLATLSHPHTLPCAYSAKWSADPGSCVPGPGTQGEAGGDLLSSPIRLLFQLLLGPGLCLGQVTGGDGSCLHFLSQFVLRGGPVPQMSWGEEDRRPRLPSWLAKVSLGRVGWVGTVAFPQ